MNKRITLKTSELRGLVNESIRRLVNKRMNEESNRFADKIYEDMVRKMKKRHSINEIFNQFSDDDFASDGDPYGLCDDDMEEMDYTLNGKYHSFNNIWVDIKNDGKPNAYIMVGANNTNDKQTFEGEEAQRLLDKIKQDAEYYGSTHVAIYRNLYQYVL